MNELFEQQNTLYNLCSQIDFSTWAINDVNNGVKTLSWDILDIKYEHMEPCNIRKSGILKLNLRGNLSAKFLNIQKNLAKFLENSFEGIHFWVKKYPASLQFY